MLDRLMSRLLIAIAAVLALAGTAAAGTTAPPVSPAEGPDLSTIALAVTDLSGARVTLQKYIAPEGAVAAYERDFAMGGRLVLAFNAVFLYRTPTAAQQQGALVRRVLSTRAGRKAIAANYKRSLRPLKVASVVVSRPTSIAAAGDFAFRFTIVAVTNKGRLSVGFAVARVHRVLGYVTLAARRNASVTSADLAHMARTLAGRSRTGFTIGNSAPPAVTGNPVQGQTLSADRGHWVGGPETWAYQWKRCDAAGANCADIAGATAETYVVTTADAGFTLGVRIEARNPLSTLTVESALTGVVT